MKFRYHYNRQRSIIIENRTAAVHRHRLLFSVFIENEANVALPCGEPADIPEHDENVVSVRRLLL